QAFNSVTSILNMAVFKDHFVLEELVEEMKKQSTALSFGPLQPNGHLAVQGSFPALRVLRDLLLLKAKSLSEKGRREESKSHLRPRRRPQEHGGVAERRNSVREAHGEKQEVVLDTDIYRYMRCFYPRKFQGNGVVVSDVSDGEITTVCFENAGRRADAQHVVRVKEMIEDLSIKLQSILCKERFYLKERTRGEKQRYKMVCERLKRRFPKVLITVCDTHIDLIGTFSEIFEFAKEVK
ncbi:RBM43 protein, partial [Ptilonorhynchus violaceus]|nr:RBM43 protein [Ptilonorhynchus violaceus]